MAQVTGDEKMLASAQLHSTFFYLMKTNATVARPCSAYYTHPRTLFHPPTLHPRRWTLSVRRTDPSRVRLPIRSPRQ